MTVALLWVNQSVCFYRMLMISAFQLVFFQLEKSSEPELFTSFSMESSTLNNSFLIDLQKLNIASTFYLLCYYVILFLKRHQQQQVRLEYILFQVRVLIIQGQSTHYSRLGYILFKVRVLIMQCKDIYYSRLDYLLFNVRAYDQRSEHILFKV